VSTVESPVVDKQARDAFFFVGTLFSQTKTQKSHGSYVSELLARGWWGRGGWIIYSNRGPPDRIMRPAASFVNCN